MIVTIVKSGTLYRAKLITYEYAQMLVEEYPSAKIPVSSEDSELINMFFDSALASLLDFLPQDISVSNEPMQVSITIPDHPLRNASNNISIDTGIKDYILNYILNEWYKLRNPDRCQFHIMAMNKERDNINRRINQRTEPVRRPQHPW